MNTKITPLHGNQDHCSSLKAQVKSVSDNCILIDTGEGVINSSKAFSCIVDPQINDIVLVNVVGVEYYVLAILERPLSQEMTLSFPSDLKMQLPKGQFDLLASKDINLMTAEKTQVFSGSVNMTSSNIDINTGKLKANAKDIDAYTQNTTLSTNSLNVIAKHISQKTDVLVRWVENVETLNIGNLIQKIRKNYTSHSDQAVITAKQDMRIDGERIHMG
ncbi:DUF3540 domain-containing protein [Marinicellulosiphila megalodicopiae]|uniref:DUF3540 domain-containing protein n=1 Tax=Marinicellulosiphila megalodicopiae TaxID=2724896 RepID=UPI003BB19C84